MRNLEKLKAPDAFSQLERDFPRGAAFRHIVGAMVRQIVIVLNDRLYELESPIRISVEPQSDRNEKDGTPRLPSALIVRDGDYRKTIGIATQECSVMVAGKLIVTSRDSAVMRVASALVEAIESILQPNATSELA